MNYMQLDTDRMEYVASSIHVVWDGILQVNVSFFLVPLIKYPKANCIIAIDCGVHLLVAQVFRSLGICWDWGDAYSSSCECLFLEEVFLD